MSVAKMDKENFISYVNNLSVLELKEHVTWLEEHFGVSASAMAMPAAAPQAGAGAAAAAEEKTEFTVHLAKSGDNKIQVIKVVRQITGLGLKEAKDLVEGAPKVLKEGVSKDEAEKIKKELAESGATVEIK